MYAQVEKSKENKSKAVANSVSQKKGKNRTSDGFADNRSEAITQRKLQQKMSGDATVPIQLGGGDMHYWYQTELHGEWTKAGVFKNHKKADEWLKANRENMGIVGFGRGAKNKYK